MWKVFRVALQKGCVIRDLRVKPSLISAGGSDDQNTPDGLHSRAVCTATAHQIHGAFASQRPPVRVLIEDVTKGDNDSRHNGVRFALDHDRTVASEEDPGGGNPTGWSDDQHQDNHKEDQNDQADQQTDCNWNSWYKTFRQDNWSHHHPCHVLEAVTWGTAILSGFRFSQFLDPLKDRPQEVPRCWFQQMQRVATSIIKQHLLQFEAGYYSVSTTVKSVLPRGGFSSLPLPSPVAEDRDQKLDGKRPVKPSGVFSFGHMRNDAGIPLSENVSPEVHEAVKQLPKPSTTTASEVSFTETLSNWGEVLRTVTAAMNNAEGVRLACHGDMEGAIRLWKRAVDEAKSEKAHFNLALAYEQGLGVDKDLDKALEHYSLASLKDHPASLFNSAMIHLRRPLEADKNREIAIKLLEKASELGLKEAQRELGVLYTELPNRDMVRAASLFEKAAAQKDVKSTYFLGVCYENGWGIKLNETTAATLYETAAGAGHAEAQYNLGVFYETGRGGLTCDQRKALELYRLSDGCGCIKARQELKRLGVTLAKDKETHDTSFSRTGSDKKTICSGPQQSKTMPSASRITRLTSSCEADFLSEDSDTESFYLDSVSESSSSEDEALNFTVSQKRVSSASGKSNKLMFGGKKSLRSGIFIGFSSDEETSDSSEVEECTEDRPIKLPLSQLA